MTNAKIVGKKLVIENVTTRDPIAIDARPENQNGDQIVREAKGLEELRQLGLFEDIPVIILDDANNKSERQYESYADIYKASDAPLWAASKSIHIEVPAQESPKLTVYTEVEYFFIQTDIFKIIERLYDRAASKNLEAHRWLFHVTWDGVIRSTVTETPKYIERGSGV